ncbi:unnamed protein product [Closterium sp. Yama58-4]|nr:unnamed protein product [Closterium sp. Yama58-4]
MPEAGRSFDLRTGRGQAYRKNASRLWRFEDLKGVANCCRDRLQLFANRQLGTVIDDLIDDLTGDIINDLIDDIINDLIGDIIGDRLTRSREELHREWLRREELHSSIQGRLADRRQ